jgi:hypothetical protein
MHDLEVELIKALTCGAEGSEMVCAADIARVCRFTERHVMNLHKRREMPTGRRFGRVWRWHARTIARWIALGTVEPTPSANDQNAREEQTTMNDRAVTKTPARARPGARSTY